jgi:hypothetical protein
MLRLEGTQKKRENLVKFYIKKSFSKMNIS